MNTMELPKDLNTFIGRCNADEMAALLESIEHALDQSLDMPFVAGPQPKKHSDSASKNKANTVTAAKRPLNSWMAFRAFYSPIFASLQQKYISGFLTTLWKEDPFKAKWTLIAKAYSVIRDEVGKENAPLDVFLEIVVPLVGILEPHEYLHLLGWMVSNLSGVRSLVRTQVPNFRAFPQHIRSTNLSVEEIVSYCYDVGYLQEEVESTAASTSFAMATEPSFIPTPTTCHNGQGNGLQTDIAYTFDPVVSSLDLHQNAVLLAASGDMYPFNDQFRPDDQIGLRLEAQGGDGSSAFNISEWADLDTIAGPMPWDI